MSEMGKLTELQASIADSSCSSKIPLLLPTHTPSPIFPLVVHQLAFSPSSHLRHPGGVCSQIQDYNMVRMLVKLNR